jgi:hypothetical protein
MKKACHPERSEGSRGSSLNDEPKEKMKTILPSPVTAQTRLIPTEGRFFISTADKH